MRKFSSTLEVNLINGAPEGSRTPNRSVRSRVLYPIELRALIENFVMKIQSKL